MSDCKVGLMNKYWMIGGSLVLVLAIAVGSFLLGRHSAAPHTAEALVDGMLQGRPFIQISQVISLATQHVAGEVLKVELEREDGRFVYEVKLLAADGRVREVELDSEDGSLIEIEDN